jgi:CRP-like cAMP-binding protein
MDETKPGTQELIEFKPGEIVMDQGQIARGLYILMSGTLEVLFNGVKVAEIQDKGAFVGEVASILGGKRIARVVASTPVRMLRVQNVTAYFESNPSAALMMAKTLAARIMDMNKKLAAYEAIIENSIKAGDSAVEKNDLAPIKDSLLEMKTFFVRKISAG